MSLSKKEWIERLEIELPPKPMIVERNLAITAKYADWYLQKPELFKWAGMAAFASRQVGLALAFSELLHAPSRIAQPEKGFSLDPGWLFRAALNAIVSVPSFLHSLAARQLFMADLDEIRRGNNAIFFDIGWAHALYQESGLEEIEKNCSEPEDEYMLQGFRLIDEGAKILAQGSREEEAREKIWEGNILLLRHEQIKTLQPIFDAITPQGRILVSFGSELDFSGAMLNDSNAKASFSTFSGYFETLSGLRSITDGRHRWNWIENEVLPVWKRVESTYCAASLLQKQLQLFAAREPALMQQVTQFASKLYSIPGMG